MNNCDQAGQKVESKTTLDHIRPHQTTSDHTEPSRTVLRKLADTFLAQRRFFQEEQTKHFHKGETCFRMNDLKFSTEKR